MLITRRNLIASTVALIAAPAVIRVADLMPIKAPKELRLEKITFSDANGWHCVHFGTSLSATEAAKLYEAIQALNLNAQAYFVV